MTQPAQHETLWVFKFKNQSTQKFEYTQPAPLNDLLEVVNQLKIAGQFCLCVVIPDFVAEVEVKLNVESSKFFKGNAPVLDYEKIMREGKANVRTHSEVSPRKRGRPFKVKAVPVESGGGEVERVLGPVGVAVRPTE